MTQLLGQIAQLVGLSIPRDKVHTKKRADRSTVGSL